MRARVIAAADAMSARPGEGDFDRLARLAGLAKALSPDIVVEAEPGGPAVRGREAVAALATQLVDGGRTAARRAERSRGRPRRALVARRRDRGRARDVDAPDGAPAGGAAAAFDGDVIRIELARTDDGWLIARASPVPALAR